MLLKIYIYGYLNRVQFSRRLKRECQRNVELMWLVGRLAPDFKTIADFRRDNGTGIGWRCGKRYFGDSFSIKANLRDKHTRLKRQFVTLQGVLDRKEELLIRISELYRRKTGTRWADYQLRSLKD